MRELSQLTDLHHLDALGPDHQAIAPLSGRSLVPAESLSKLNVVAEELSEIAEGIEREVCLSGTLTIRRPRHIGATLPADSSHRL
jgi:hypothetical protein